MAYFPLCRLSMTKRAGTSSAWSDSLVTSSARTACSGQCGGIQQYGKMYNNTSSSSSSSPSPSSTIENHGKIRLSLADLQRRVEAVGLELDKCTRETEEILQSDRSAFREEYLLGLAVMRNQMFSEILTNIRQEKKVQAEVLDRELIAWKRQQQLAGNGLKMTLSLETLQEFCEVLVSVLWTTRAQLKQLESLQSRLGPATNCAVSLEQVNCEVTELLSNLVTGTFIIEKQPPQVMKTNTKFTATVRLLVGGALNVQRSSPTVRVSIISECQARNLLTHHSQTSCVGALDLSSGEITNGAAKLEFQAATREVSTTFTHLQLRNIKRTERSRQTESVMEEKSSLLFWTEFQVGELRFQVWTLSLPVVVTVHGNQEPQALATITWDNAFSEWGRLPFQVPDRVSWPRLAETLNMKWSSQCSQGRGLSSHNLHCLACKVMRNDGLTMEELPGLQVSWAQFCREQLPGKTFSFWEWFYRSMNLNFKYMKEPWAQGLVMGFVSKQEVKRILIDKSTVAGTFLLRFSDSELGGVTIAYVKQETLYHERVVEMVLPFTSADLVRRPIAESVIDLGQKLTFLYQSPEQGGPREKKVWKKFQRNQPTVQAGSGYVPFDLRYELAQQQPDQGEVQE